MNARERILGSVRAALHGREQTLHPGDFQEWRPAPLGANDRDGEDGADGQGVSIPRNGSAVDGFGAMLRAAGGEVVVVPDHTAAAAWLADFSSGFSTAASGATVPIDLRPDLPAADPHLASLGVSMASGAVAETGSLVMDARDGRRAQLLAPTHVVFVHAGGVDPTLRSALARAKTNLPSGIGLHSGPSKSADIGQILVKGVHGPGRLIAVVIERPGAA